MEENLQIENNIKLDEVDQKKIEEENEMKKILESLVEFESRIEKINPSSESDKILLKFPEDLEVKIENRDITTLKPSVTDVKKKKYNFLF